MCPEHAATSSSESEMLTEQVLSLDGYSIVIIVRDVPPLGHVAWGYFFATNHLTATNCN